MRTVLIAMVFLFTEFGFAQTEVTVTVTDIPTNEGNVLIGMYTEGTFLKAAPDYGAISEVKDHTATAVFENVPEGEYAISCFQDQNGNKRFDFQPNGAPAEPYGVSNNAISLYGPPIWSDAKFTVSGEPVEINIKF